MSPSLHTFVRMREHSDRPDHGGPDTAADGSPLPAIDGFASDFHTTMAGLLRQVCEALRWGATQTVAGCTVRDYLTIEAGLPGWLAGQLESVARRLPAVPHVAQLFADGVLSFDQLARFVRMTSAYNGELLARLDAEAASLAEALAEEHRLHAFAEQVAMLVEELRAPGWRQRQERRAERGQRWFAQQDFDGGGFVGAELDALGFATVVEAVMAETDDTQTRNLGVQRARAEASVRIAQVHLAGDTDGRPARPTVIWHVDVADATVDRFGQQLRIAGGNDRRLVPVSLQLLATLADQADHIIQLRDGYRPLDELAVDSDDIPARVRRVVLARDRGCRFPDCRRTSVHLHHIVPRSQGGTHTADNLIGA